MGNAEFDFGTRIGKLFMVKAFAASALAVAGLLLCIAVRFRLPSVDIHIDIRHSMVLSQSSEMLHESGSRRHPYITTSSTYFSAILSSLSVCSMCRPARLPRQLAVNFSRWIAKHQVDNRGGVEAVRHVHNTTLPTLFRECTTAFTQELGALLNVFSRCLSLNADPLSPLGLPKQISDVGVALRYVLRQVCKALMQ